MSKLSSKIFTAVILTMVALSCRTPSSKSNKTSDLAENQLSLTTSPCYAFMSLSENIIKNNLPPFDKNGLHFRDCSYNNTLDIGNSKYKVTNFVGYSPLSGDGYVLTKVYYGIIRFNGGVPENEMNWSLESLHFSKKTFSVEPVDSLLANGKIEFDDNLIHQ